MSSERTESEELEYIPHACWHKRMTTPCPCTPTTTEGSAILPLHHLRTSRILW